MKPLITGLIHVTGEPGTGKTTFALECGPTPDRIAFIDHDIKGRSTVNQLLADGAQFGMYRDLNRETRGMKEHQLHAHCLGVIESILPAQYDALVWDTWTPFEATFKPVVSKNPKKFRDEFDPMASIKGAEEWLASFDYEARIIGELLERVPLVILTTHLKNYNIGKQRVEGKFIPDCKRPIVEKSLFRIWLRQNPTGRAVPVGLILKRFDRKIVTEAGLRTVNILPRKVIPQAEDQSLWDTIRWYWTNPFGDRAPNPEETPNEFELSILDGTLTEDQRDAFRLALLEAERTKLFGETVLPNADLAEEALEIITTGRDAGESAGIIKARLFKIGYNVPLIKIMKIMKEKQDNEPGY